MSTKKKAKKLLIKWAKKMDLEDFEFMTYGHSNDKDTSFGLDALDPVTGTLVTIGADYRKKKLSYLKYNNYLGETRFGREDGEISLLSYVKKANAFIKDWDKKEVHEFFSEGISSKKLPRAVELLDSLKGLTSDGIGGFLYEGGDVLPL